MSPFGRHDAEDDLLRLVRLIEEQTLILCQIVALLSRPYQSTTAVLTKGDTMPLEVGATQTVTLTFYDASGNPEPPPTGDGSGLVVTIASDDTSVCTLGATSASGDTAVATATGVSVGSFNYTATVANTSGAPLVDNDGVTPFVQPSPLPETVTANTADQAVTAVLSTSSPATPAPSTPPSTTTTTEAVSTTTPSA